MVKFGIIGAGNIAHRFAKSLAAHPDGKLVAISARNEEKGRAFAKEFSAPDIYQDGMALLKDADVEAVYIALPHGLHAEWSVRAIRAGKAVLCEKPAALTEAEMNMITAAAEEEGVLFFGGLESPFCTVVRRTEKRDRFRPHRKAPFRGGTALQGFSFWR